MSNFKNRLYLIIIRAYARAYYLRISKKNINFASYFGEKVAYIFSKILKIVHFAKYSLQNEKNIEI